MPPIQVDKNTNYSPCQLLGAGRAAGAKVIGEPEAAGR
jgi:hypothetical protein